MTGKSGVATAVAAPTIVQRIGNGATLLGGGVAVLMCRCGVAAASLRRLTGRGDGFVRQHKAVLLHLCSTSSLCSRFGGVLGCATARSAYGRIDVARRSMLRPRTTSLLESARKRPASVRKDTLEISKPEALLRRSAPQSCQTKLCGTNSSPFVGLQPLRHRRDDKTMNALAQEQLQRQAESIPVLSEK